VLFIFGCGGASQRQHEQTRETLQSWINSVDLAQQHRADGHVPQVFIAQLLKGADKTLARERDQIRSHPDLQSLAQQLELKIRQARESHR